mgnify:CR=1 FL=1
MYEIYTANSKVEKRLREYLEQRKDISDKLDKLRQNPRKANEAHLLHGKLAGTWSCWLGSNIRILYIIDDDDKTIIIEAIGSHNIY